MMCEFSGLNVPISYKGYEIIIRNDDDGESPRGWDNLGTLSTWGSYILGEDARKDSQADFMLWLACEADSSVDDRINYWENLRGWTRLVNYYGRADHASDAIKACSMRVESIINKAIDKHYIMIPVYLYSHSGITINTSGFSCGWDSGQVGWIWVSIDTVKKEFGWKRMNKSRRARVVEILEDEIKLLDSYIRGDVYGYQIEKDGEFVDSCSGYFGDPDKEYGAFDIAKSFIDADTEEK